MAYVEERPHGTGRTTWRVVWRENGERQRVTFADPLEAVKFQQLVTGSGNHWPAGWQRPRPAAPPVASGKLTFDQWARQTIATRRRATDRTRGDYLRNLDNHFALLAHVPIDEITDAHRARWIDDRTAAGLSEKTIRNLHNLAASVIAAAITHRPPLAEHNPFADDLARMPGVRTEEMHFLTPGEYDTLERHVRDQYRPLTRLLFGTGLRYGEATALHVRDVDLLGRKSLTVTKAWKRTDTSSYVIGEPKTPRSRRTISLSDELVELLIPLVTARRGSELLFPGAGGGRLPHVEFYKRGWAPAVARANVCDIHYSQQRDGRGNPPTMPDPCHCPGVLGKRPRIHDARHSHASWLIAAGVPITVISRRLGHSSITVTIDRYGHLDPALDAQVNAAVDRALSRS